MKAEDKALAIHAQYDSIINNNAPLTPYQSDTAIIAYKETVKKCAIAAVEQIQSLPNLGRNNSNNEGEYDYWQEVKQHLTHL